MAAKLTNFIRLLVEFPILVSTEGKTSFEEVVTFRYTDGIKLVL